MKYWKLKMNGWKPTRQRVLYIENEREKWLRRSQNMLIGIILISAVLMMTACSKSIKPCAEPQKAVIPNSLTQECEPLTPLKSDNMAALAGKIVEISGQYYRCAAGKSSLVKSVKALKGKQGE